MTQAPEFSRWDIHLFAASGVAFGADNRAKEQDEVRKAGQDALNALYKVQPSARKAVESAAGYAAFSNFGMKIFLAGGGSRETKGRPIKARFRSRQACGFTS